MKRTQDNGSRDDTMPNRKPPHDALGSKDRLRASADVLGAQSLIDQFEASLREETALAAEDREYLEQQFRDAIAEAKESKGTVEVMPRSEWMELVEALQHSEALDQDEANALIRQLDEVMQPIKRPLVSKAMEFGRLCQEQGETAALEWYKQQAGLAGDRESSPIPVSSDVSQFRDTITRSRSRRLRGPPHD